MRLNIIGIKEKIKKYRQLVFIYERVYMGFHIIKKEVMRNLRVIKTRIKVKTRYSFGKDNPDKTFFVLTCDAIANGLYSTIFYLLPFIEYADKNGYIPIIDLSKTYLPSIHDVGGKDIDNAWEYYYEQPVSEYTLEEVYRSKNVIIMVDSACKVDMPRWNDLFPANEKVLHKWNDYIEKYIRLLPNLKERVDKEYLQLGFSNKKVLGVGIRAGYRAGMMRNESLYNGHPKVPTCEEIMDVVEQKMKMWGCDSIFLSCDDREYCEKIKKRFGNDCLCIERRLTHYFENDMPIEQTDIERYCIEKIGYSIKELTEEYIVETYLLARCNSFYSCIGGGAEFAYFVNGGKYEHLEVYNEGKYEGIGN